MKAGEVGMNENKITLVVLGVAAVAYIIGLIVITVREKKNSPGPSVVIPKNRIVFIEFDGALVDKFDDDLVYTPRGKISINPARIAGYYDHTIMVDGYKIRVMETYAQIALKILEATK